MKSFAILVSSLKSPDYIVFIHAKPSVTTKWLDQNSYFKVPHLPSILPLLLKTSLLPLSTKSLELAVTVPLSPNVTGLAGLLPNLEFERARSGIATDNH